MIIDIRKYTNSTANKITPEIAEIAKSADLPVVGGFILIGKMGYDIDKIIIPDFFASSYYKGIYYCVTKDNAISRDLFEELKLIALKSDKTAYVLK